MHHTAQIYLHIPVIVASTTQVRIPTLGVQTFQYPILPSVESLWIVGYAAHYTALHSTAAPHYTSLCRTSFQCRVHDSSGGLWRTARMTLSMSTMDSWPHTALHCTAAPNYIPIYTIIQVISTGYQGCLGFLSRRVGAAPEHRSVIKEMSPIAP